MPDEAIVVRGGECKLADLRVSAEKHEKNHNEPALSGWCIPDSSPEEVAEHGRKVRGPQYLKHSKIRYATAGEFRAAGFPVEEGPGHVAIKLPSPLSDKD